jgi:hypothetical protein
MAYYEDSWSRHAELKFAALTSSYFLASYDCNQVEDWHTDVKRQQIPGLAAACIQNLRDCLGKLHLMFYTNFIWIYRNYPSPCSFMSSRRLLFKHVLLLRTPMTSRCPTRWRRWELPSAKNQWGFAACGQEARRSEVHNSNSMSFLSIGEASNRAL